MWARAGWYGAEKCVRNGSKTEVQVAAPGSEVALNLGLHLPSAEALALGQHVVQQGPSSCIRMTIWSFASPAMFAASYWLVQRGEQSGRRCWLVGWWWVGSGWLVQVG